MSRRSTFGEVLRGAGYAFRGVGFVLVRPQLWPLLVAPFVVLVVLFLGGAWASWGLVGAALDALWTPSSDVPPWLSTVWGLLELAVRVSVLVLLAAGLYFTVNILATPFNDLLSQRVETARLGPRPEETTWGVFFADIAQSAWHSILALGLWVAVMVTSALLNVVPGVGTLAAWTIEVAATALFIARESMDGALSRRRFSFGHKLRIVRAHWPVFLGFGLVGSVFVFVPVLNLVVLPLSIAGGTLLYCDLEREGRVPPRG